MTHNSTTEPWREDRSGQVLVRKTSATDLPWAASGVSWVRRNVGHIEGFTVCVSHILSGRAIPGLLVDELRES